MRTEIADEKALRRVQPASLVAYASAAGWRRSEAFGKTSFVYEKSGSPELIIPNTIAINDYASAVARVIATLAEEERRDQLAVYRDLFQVESDVIRVRAPKAELDGSIRVEAGVAMFQHARDMLLAAACAAREPRRVYRLGSHKEALDYLHAVRFGQTEQGSYVVTLLSPVPLEEPTEFEALLGLDSWVEPFQRRVTRTLMRSLHQAHRATVAATRGGSSAFDAAVADGVNANLCDAVASLIEQGAGLDVRVAWSKHFPAAGEPSQVRFKLQEAEILREAAEHLRNSEPQNDATLSGYVRALGREHDSMQGTVAIKAVVDGKLASVKTSLTGTMYTQAIEAHRLRKTITISGNLARIGQRWHLDNPTNLHVDEDDFDDLLS